MMRVSALFPDAIFAAAVILTASVAGLSAQSMMTNDDQMTLYTFDKDAAGKSACYDDCAKNWPPYLGKSGEEKGRGWALVARTDGSMQWAHEGKPTYLYHEDMKAGDMKGEGKGGVWHVLK